MVVLKQALRCVCQGLLNGYPGLRSPLTVSFVAWAELCRFQIGGRLHAAVCRRVTLPFIWSDHPLSHGISVAGYADLVRKAALDLCLIQQPGMTLELADVRLMYIDSDGDLLEIVSDNDLFLTVHEHTYKLNGKNVLITCPIVVKRAESTESSNPNPVVQVPLPCEAPLETTSTSTIKHENVKGSVTFSDEIRNDADHAAKGTLPPSANEHIHQFNQAQKPLDTPTACSASFSLVEANRLVASLVTALQYAVKAQQHIVTHAEIEFCPTRLVGLCATRFCYDFQDRPVPLCNGGASSSSKKNAFYSSEPHL
jgi:PB1 domain